MTNASVGSVSFCIRHALFVVVAGATLASCRPRLSPGAVVELLWAPEGAQLSKSNALRPVTRRNNRAIYVDGSADLVFQAEMSCDALRMAIVDHFDHLDGWQRRDTLYDQPQTPLPARATCHPGPGGVSGWRAEWDDRDGDVVSYSVISSGASASASARGVYLPADLVETIRANRLRTPPRADLLGITKGAEFRDAEDRRIKRDRLETG